MFGKTRKAYSYFAFQLDARHHANQPWYVEPWGLVEMWIEDRDGVRIVLVEVPDDHPLRRDQR